MRATQTVYTPKEVAEMLKVNERTVRRWVRTGQLRAYRFGRQLRIPAEALEEFGRPPAAGGEDDWLAGCRQLRALLPQSEGSVELLRQTRLAQGVKAVGIEEIKKAAVPILRRYGVARAYLFGSYARGEQTEGSDVDFLVEYAPGARKSLLSHVRLINELKDALRTDVDVVTEAALRPEIREEVLRERRAIM